jgi:hypothetical protein
MQLAVGEDHRHFGLGSAGLPRRVRSTASRAKKKTPTVQGLHDGATVAKVMPPIGSDTPYTVC